MQEGIWVVWMRREGFKFEERRKVLPPHSPHARDRSILGPGAARCGAVRSWPLRQLIVGRAAGECGRRYFSRVKVCRYCCQAIEESSMPLLSHLLLTIFGSNPVSASPIPSTLYCDNRGIASPSSLPSRL